ncbi:MAG: glycine--tRNA ligase subunit beta, partial [Rhodospirillales bacterium]|nr:glycine--tRNA ligase subunit beta [Rhodospirillales bacterium]
DDLKKLVTGGLKEAGLTFDGAEAYVTPRRLALLVDGLPTAQPDVKEERKGPRVGAPDKAIEGFLKAAGLDSLSQCETRSDPKKGDFYVVVIEKTGEPTAKVLPEILFKAMFGFPWPKSMVWGKGKFRWVRPLHSVLVLFDGDPLDLQNHREGLDEFMFPVGVQFNQVKTRGHRFLAPGPFAVKDFADYKQKLRDAKVMLDAVERRELILTEAKKLAKDAGLTLKDDAGLLAEVAGLVEWPVVMMGKIDDAFMDLPDEVLTTSMRSHQKYFSTLDAEGKLAPRFVFVANNEAKDGGAQIVKGNERVLRARLADAKFFWDQDRKAALESRVGALGERIF